MAYDTKRAAQVHVANYTKAFRAAHTLTRFWSSAHTRYRYTWVLTG